MPGYRRLATIPEGSAIALESNRPTRSAGPPATAIAARRTPIMARNSTPRVPFPRASYHPTRLACIVLAAWVFCTSVRAEGPAQKEVQALLDRQVSDWNKKDLDAFCQGYWNSADLVFLSGGEKTRGWTAMRD